MNIHAIEEINDAPAERPPVLAIRFGRGRTGGTTFLDFLIQRARRADRQWVSPTAIPTTRRWRAFIHQGSRAGRFNRGGPRLAMSRSG